MGILFAVISAIFQSARDLTSKRLSFDVGSTVSTFASFAFAIPYYIFGLTILWLVGLEDFAFTTSFLGLALLRSVVDAFAEWFKMNAYEHADISIGSTFLSLSPMFVLILSPIINGDNISARGYFAISIIVIGTLLLAYRPKKTASKSQMKGILFAFMGSWAFALNICIDKMVVEHASAVLSGFVMTLLSGIYFIPVFFRNKQNVAQLKSSFKLFSLRGLTEFIFMSSKLSALQFMPAQYVMGIQKLNLLLSIIGGKVFFKEEDFARRVFCGLLVLTGVVMIVFEVM